MYFMNTGSSIRSMENLCDTAEGYVTKSDRRAIWLVVFGDIDAYPSEHREGCCK